MCIRDSSDIEGECLLPAALKAWEPSTADGAPSVAAQLVEALKPYDADFSARVAAATSEGKVLVPVGRVDMKTGEAAVTLETVDKGTALSRCQGNDNIIAIYSKRYSSQPLVIQGPGAGAEITASGLFSDLLSLARSCVEWTQTGC